jgi:hypothetical protein
MREWGSGEFGKGGDGDSAILEFSEKINLLNPSRFFLLTWAF